MGVRQTLPPAWKVPYQRNPFFTGREDVLSMLHNALAAGKTAALTQPHAISGLGGIGKTQTAVEYAYRYAGQYQAVLWTRAETRERLNADFVTLADLLNLPEKGEQAQSRIVAAVKRWLVDYTGWLLILDNADDLPMARDFLPPTARGHILLTTRAQAMGGVARRVEIEKMGPEEGVLFLLRRANFLAPDATIDKVSMADRTKARAIVQAMDGLPLALDQAGAYIEALLSFSLVERHPEDKPLSIHRLVQEVLKNGMDENMQRTWAERTVRAVNSIFPYVEFTTWPDCQRYLPHAQVCAELIKQWNLTFNEAARLLNEVGLYLKGRAQYTEAEPFYQQSLAIYEKVQGPEHPHTATCLNNLANLYVDQGRYGEAEPLLQRAIAIGEKTLGAEHPEGAVSLFCIVLCLAAFIIPRMRLPQGLPLRSNEA